MKILIEQSDLNKLKDTTLALDIENNVITFVFAHKSPRSGKIYIVEQGRVHIGETENG